MPQRKSPPGLTLTAPDLREDLLLELADGNVGDVGLGDDDKVDGAVLVGRLVAAVSDAVGHDLARKSRVVLRRVDLIARVNLRLLHVESEVLGRGPDLARDEVGAGAGAGAASHGPVGVCVRV